MKKIVLGVLAVLVSAFAFGACDFSQVESLFSGVGNSTLLESILSSSESTQTSSENEEEVNSSSNSEDNGDDEQIHIYQAFTATEIELFQTYVGAVIPFIPNNEYYVEGYNEETDYENGLCFYVIGNTQAEFDAYRALYSDYTLTSVEEDEVGDTWYSYEKDNLIIDMCYYFDEGENALVVYVCKADEGNGDQNNPEGGEDDKIPDEMQGVCEVDFTQATNVKNVTDQYSFEGGCPTTGKVNVLVIPVEFSDVTAASKGYKIEKIETIFNGGAGTTDYYSVKEYYSISSYGELDLNFVVWGAWFKPRYSSTYYAGRTQDGDLIGDQMVMDEALAYLESRMDLKEFDSDGNEIIDAVVMINTLEIDSDNIWNWAYRYWNLYTDNRGYYYEYDGVYANDYLWASYKFMLETREAGRTTYNDNTMNPYTYIHEFGHVLGADDYYDTSYTHDYGPMDGYDVMDMMLGDHNAYTKFNYGWLTKARLITAEESVTISLKSFTETGDSVIIANNWNDKLGAYQEYYIIVYYTNTGLNGGEYGYFEEEGIVVYHVNATLASEVINGKTYYDVANNNVDPSHEYGTENNLIELVQSVDGSYVYGAYDSLSAKEMLDNGQKISYVFTVNSIAEDKATVTFRKNA